MLRKLSTLGFLAVASIATSGQAATPNAIAANLFLHENVASSPAYKAFKSLTHAHSTYKFSQNGSALRIMSFGHVTVQGDIACNNVLLDITQTTKNATPVVRLFSEDRRLMSYCKEYIGELIKEAGAVLNYSPAKFDEWTKLQEPTGTTGLSNILLHLRNAKVGLSPELKAFRTHSLAIENVVLKERKRWFSKGSKLTLELIGSSTGKKANKLTVTGHTKMANGAFFPFEYWVYALKTTLTR